MKFVWKDMNPKIIPSLFEMEDYNSCMDESNIFCKMYAHLQTMDNNSQIWNYIMESHGNNDRFDRSVLHRGLCVPRQNARDLESVRAFSEIVINKEIRSKNLTADLDVISCHDNVFSMTTYDYIFSIICVTYFGFIFVATIYSLMRGRSKYISIFSIHHNWQKRLKPFKSDDYVRLKSIQGVRLFSLIMILWTHSKMRYGMAYIANPPFFEKVMTYPIVKHINILDVFTVNSYFMISSWLLTIQILDVTKNLKEFSVKQLWIIIINRYFRVAILASFMIAIYSTSIGRYMAGPINMELVYPHQKSCSTNWLYSILFINNFQSIENMCNPITWYLAADFQMYVLNAIMFYIIVKYNLDAFKTSGIVVAMASVLYGVIIFFSNTDIMYKPTVRNIDYRILSRSMLFFITYQSTISIFGCSSVGIFLGLIYTKTKNLAVKNNCVNTFIWSIVSAGLPSIAIMISVIEFEGVPAAIVGPLIKPLFVLGIGIGILGMSHNIGGLVKRICEARIVEIMGNFNYGIYICQVPFCFCYSKYQISYVKVGYSEIIEDYLRTVVLCFIVGILLTLIVEEPAATIQKMLLPNNKSQIYQNGTNKKELKKRNYIPTKFIQ